MMSVYQGQMLMVISIINHSHLVFLYINRIKCLFYVKNHLTVVKILRTIQGMVLLGLQKMAIWYMDYIIKRMSFGTVLSTMSVMALPYKMVLMRIYLDYKHHMV